MNASTLLAGVVILAAAAGMAYVAAQASEQVRLAGRRSRGETIGAGVEAGYEVVKGFWNQVVG